MLNTTLATFGEISTTDTATAAAVGATVGTIFGFILIFGLIFAILSIIAYWKIFEKAGEKGWKILIPIYDVYILFKICGIKNWFWAMLCASIIASILMAVNMPPYIEDATGYHLDYSVDLSKYPTYVIGIVISCVASIIMEVAIAIKLAKAFGKGVGYTLGIIFFPYIFTLILGFGKAKYSKKAVNA